MGGKGGGGSTYYQQPADTSGYGTPEEAKKTLAAEAPIDYSQYKENINAKKAANDATAKAQPPPPAVFAEGASNTETTDEATGDKFARNILAPPGFWAELGKKPSPVVHPDPTLTKTQI
jgi:hypothetical protein